MRAVILVPRRADNGARDVLWAWCRAWWEAHLPSLPIYEGHHDEGLFNRSAAVNRAAALAGKWDVAVIIDSDVICDPERVHEAIALAHGFGDRLVMPFDRRHNLNRQGSERIVNGERGNWKRFIAKTYTEMCSSCVMVPRKLWDSTGGFDEAFQGWGFEDSAFALACETFGGHMPYRLAGELWHLWHATAPEGRKGTPSYRANRSRKEMYARALGDQDATRALAEGRTWQPPQATRVELIPRILHRTVPTETTAQVETWWARFGELHPDWELRTYRDPLDPAEWPLTAHAWDSCTSGAQRAGLIRLEALYRFGGIYVDSDCEPFQSLEPLLACHAFAAWEDELVIPDAVLGAEPEHPVIRTAISLAIARIGQGAWASGPGVTTELFTGRPDILLLPPGSFYDVHYRDPRRQRKMQQEPSPWTFLRHHYAGSWLEDVA